MALDKNEDVAYTVGRKGGAWVETTVGRRELLLNCYCMIVNFCASQARVES